ncbi:hypothetical protein ACIBCR_15435 [Micromonospora echinospora]|uniref:hypothetical protein n=1 Tax=Micromonospora echinospora TaxID=1877 RepID=UPI0037A6CA86
MAITTAHVLADIQRGEIRIGADDYITVPEGLPLDQHEAYRLTVVGLLSRSLAMRPVPDGTPGLKTLLLTSLGAYALASGAANPDRYQSRRAYGVVDRQGSGQEVIAR